MESYQVARSGLTFMRKHALYICMCTWSYSVSIHCFAIKLDKDFMYSKPTLNYTKNWIINLIVVPTDI